MMMLQTSHEDIVALGRKPWAAANELQAIIGTYGSIRAVYDTEQAAESSEPRIAPPNWGMLLMTASNPIMQLERTPNKKPRRLRAGVS
jgi:hypothetical protein